MDTTLPSPGAQILPYADPGDSSLRVARSDAGTPRVFLLLSTFNGAAFLAEQLDSLLAQTHENWVLFWRDDGSADETTAILAHFTAMVGPARCIRFSGLEGRVYPAASYFALLRAALPSMAASDAIAFVDQDDLWLPTKLHLSLSSLAASDPDIASLYCARLRVVDADLQQLTETRISLPLPGFPAALTQNIATGCTIMLNRRAADLIARSQPPDASMHDWWCYLVVTAAGWYRAGGRQRRRAVSAACQQRGGHAAQLVTPRRRGSATRAVAVHEHAAPAFGRAVGAAGPHHGIRPVKPLVNCGWRWSKISRTGLRPCGHRD